MGPVVLDASALIGALGGEPSRSEVEELLRRRPPPSISASNLAEVVDNSIRKGGASPVEVRTRINLLIAGGMEIEPVWLPTARLAGQLRAEHYHRSETPVSVADCVCLATAIRLGAALATTDPALATVARGVGVEVIPLPNSRGARP